MPLNEDGNLAEYGLLIHGRTDLTTEIQPRQL